jgi:pyroglutamyl-peptidase
MTRRVLVTGFGPFGPNARNPTGEVARALHGRRLNGVEVHGVMLPVSWARAWPELSEAARHLRPNALVAFGVAPRAGVSFESTARNVRGPLADVDGSAGARAEAIEPGGPATLASTLPRGRLRCAPLPEVPSDDAGEYLCNYVFYRLLQHLDFIPCRGFVHTPRLWSAETPEGRGEDQIAAAMTSVVQSVVSQGVV